MKTYYDLWKFIKDISVDEFGYYQPYESSYQLQIYSNKNQVNIIELLTDLPICNIVFDLNENIVNVYRPERGICDYNNPIINTDIHSPVSNIFRIIGYNLYPFISSLLNNEAR